MRLNFFMPFGGCFYLKLTHSQMGQLLLLETWKGWAAGGGKAARLSPDPVTVWVPPREMVTGDLSPSHHLKDN